MNAKKLTALFVAAGVLAVSPMSAMAKSSEAAPDWEEYDALIAQIKAETDMAEREALMHQAEDILMDTGAVIPIYYYNDVYLQKPEVTGIYSNAYATKFFMFAENGDDTTLKLNLSSEPAYLDPALNSSVDGACLAANSFVGICSYNADGEVENALADTIDVSEDGLTWTITLKPDLKWSDGDPLNANDFVYSWNRAADEKTGADYFYMFDAIARNDDGTLQVTASEDGQVLTVVLAAPCAYFTDLLAFPTYFPVKQAAVEGWEETPGKWAQEAGFVSNGAFVLTEWKHEESMVYEKNPNYYRADEVKLERLEFMLSADDTAIFAAYNAGDIDFADSVPTDEIASLLDNPEFNIVGELGTYYVAFNVNSSLFEGMTPEQAANMRKGLSMLIDRDYICENIGQTGQEPASTFIPTGMLDGNGGIFRANDDAYTYPVTSEWAGEETGGYFDPTVDAYDANVEAGIELLKEAGFEFTEDGMLSEETPINITYITNPTSGHIAIAESLQQDFAQIGANITIEQQEWNVFLDERKQGHFDMAREGWIADFNDPINMLEMWMTDSGNNDAQFGR